MTLDEIVRWFESLTRDTAGNVGRYYAPEAFFKDPFNEVTGVAPIGRVFAHMFDQVDAPRFRILERWEAPHGAMLTWEFHFRLKGADAPLVVRGASHLRFAPPPIPSSHSHAHSPAAPSGQTSPTPLGSADAPASIAWRTCFARSTDRRS